MKCISCGGEIKLTDKACPYCGRILTETAGYRDDEEKYKKRSEKIRKKTGKVITENISMVISAGIMLLLVIGVMIAWYVKENAYHFREDALRRESVKKYDEYEPVIQKYLDAGDYTGFAAFKEYHNIAEWEAPYDDLRLLWDITKDYSSLVSAVESAAIYGSDAQKYRPEDDVSNCRSAIRRFYGEFENRLSDIDKDPYRKYMYDMRDKADIILEIYLGLDENGRKEYFEGSELKQKAYLEEVLANE